jgi:hypothetical protein
MLSVDKDLLATCDRVAAHFDPTYFTEARPN